MTYSSRNHMFDARSGSVTVGCKVYKKTSDLFMEACQIPNQDFAAELDLFSAGILEDIGGLTPSIESNPIHGNVDPAFWTVTGSQIQEVDLLLGETIDSGEQSAPLWFVSDRKTTPKQRHLVLADCMHNTGFAYADTSSIRVARYAWGAGL